MLKIVLHCNNQEYKEIEPVLSEYLTNKNIAFEIYYVGSATKFLSDYFYQKDFQLLLICKNNSLSYMLKTYYNFEKSYMHMVSGILELPLNFDSIDKELFNNIESTYCSHTVYIMLVTEKCFARFFMRTSNISND